MSEFTAHEAAIAMSLYIYNVSPGLRAEKLYSHFKGACAEPDELLTLVDLSYWATHMAFPTSVVYMEHALERYGEEARERIRTEEEVEFCDVHQVFYENGCEGCARETPGPDPDTGRGSYKDKLENPEDY